MAVGPALQTQGPAYLLGSYLPQNVAAPLPPPRDGIPRALSFALGVLGVYIFLRPFCQCARSVTCSSRSRNVGHEMAIALPPI